MENLNLIPVDLEYYEYETKRTFKEYFFYSQGPKGRIRKIVRFALMYNYPAPVYNLVLADWRKIDNNIDDEIITNNGDAKKVLATVGMIVLYFTDIFRNAIVHIKGNKAARNRLYQMNINIYLSQIQKIVYVYGSVNRKRQLFQKNVDYEKFFISRDDYFISREEYVIVEEQNEIYMTLSQKNKEEKIDYKVRVVEGPDEIDDNSPAIRKKTEEAKRGLEEMGFVAAGFCMKPELEQE